MVSSTFLFIILMVGGTFLLGVIDIFLKKYLRGGIDGQLLLGMTWVVAGIFLIPLVWYSGIPTLKPGFWSDIVATSFLNIISQSVFMRAFALSDASLIAPLRLISPPLIVITGFFILGEIPTAWGVTGIFVTMAGLWLLLAGEQSLRMSFLSHRGVQWGIVGSVLFALSFPFDKKVVVASSALFATMVVLCIVGTSVIIERMVRRKDFRREFRQKVYEWRYQLIFIAVLTATASVMTSQALQYALVAYAASLKRLWSFWTILLAGHLLNEKHTRSRLFATAVMFLGIIITVLLG